MSGVVWFFFVSAGVMYFVALAIKVEQIITLLGKIRDELVMANNPAVSRRSQWLSFTRS